ncbi:hypothetical protein JCGZ_11780 [Jatropha curcas]|uniref:18S pre-ribosomal assembly protein gar2-like protein n=1 Tax=Jatropha curcas TaxID=180498 RepID=A0A067KHT2_JATCU|nr:uncharacterized protein LOC105640684 isoform X2 [Jatropha curcas]XP_012080461.1 uncharacterized protein LOC105640684 isoform X2 [Jatropha curcas]XP_012080462.1 uncharacterized protein LOC105640684 isoform X2 [Jatropha curcas]XP_012080463.1 uncharacterized protein LOC105640684 isoform X2 [Jatropha curcas]XP_012080464.1 uncharacterized protein LOC105640684 isoform X2 [Jatropha curcas]XP_012080465.1 uncharacterized protein LOC105640684 isoform X2 [Jatropha curcas]XP_020537509.1 uncharacterize
MKLDGEQVLCHGTIDHKPGSKHFGCSNIALDSTGLKSGNGIVNEEQNGAFCDLKGRESNSDHLQYTVNDENNWTASKLDSSMRADALTDDNEKEVRDFVAPIPLSLSSLKVESFEGDSVFYVDKNVMEPELPELVVCYKENTYHVIKDICIDEGVPSKDKFLFDTIDEKNLRTLLFHEKHRNSEVRKETADQDIFIPESLKSLPEDEKSALDLPIPDVFISSAENGSKNEISLHDSEEFMTTGKIEDDTMEEIANGKSKEIFSLGELLSMPEVGTELSQPKFSHDSMHEAKQQPIQRPSENTILATASSCDEAKNGNELTSFVRPMVPAAEVSDCHHDEEISRTKALDHSYDEAVLASPALNSATQESEKVCEGEKLASHNLSSERESTNISGCGLANNSNVKSESINFYTPASAGEEDSQNGGSENLNSRSSRLEETNTEPCTSQLQHGIGESSFSAAGPLSGLISYSGPIAYSGSLSLRSDSSTTSTRSFAFPILQSEWNSSPVRMAKADRRRFQKQRSWKQGLLCCRF